MSPCVTLRENTERPITVSQGTNTVVGTNPDRIQACYREVVNSGGKRGRVPELWDGKAAERIVNVVNAWVAGHVDDECPDGFVRSPPRSTP
ncbi:MAG: UDP-N-acetylglucosamine 2-epimerase [Halioglobus sp.]